MPARQGRGPHLSSQRGWGPFIPRLQGVGYGCGEGAIFPGSSHGGGGSPPDSVFIECDVPGSVYGCGGDVFLICIQCRGRLWKGYCSGRGSQAHRDILRALPPSVPFQALALEALGGLHIDALGVISRLHWGFNKSAVSHDAFVCLQSCAPASFCYCQGGWWEALLSHHIRPEIVPSKFWNASETSSQDQETQRKGFLGRPCIKT